MFKHFAQFSTSSETWATRATWATETPKPRKPAASEAERPVAQNESAWATVGNRDQAVAQVAQRQEEWATEADSRKMAENSEFLEPVAQVAQVAQENDKAEIVEWDPETWRAIFDERAGIAEHDGGLSRADAETRAYECCVMEWLWRNQPPASGPERCAHCGKGLGVFDGVPFLKGDGGHTWLHDRCHGPWTAKRRAEAAAALAIHGLRLQAGKS